MNDRTKDRIMVLIANGEVPHPERDSEEFDQNEGWREVVDDSTAGRVTYSDVQVAYKLANEGRPHTSFSDVRGSGNSGGARPANKTKLRKVENEDKNNKTVYEIVCPSCYGKGEANSWHGWNNTVKCRNCGTEIGM